MERHEFSTGILVWSRLTNMAVGFQPISEVICKLQVRDCTAKVSLMWAHAPHEESDDEENETVYKHIESVYESYLSQDVMIVFGDCKYIIGDLKLRPYARYLKAWLAWEEKLS